ncbi:MAG: PAS domain-containing protein [Proteobacteria bacterium]|nr:PAS domain-containing protein [Pseudomonadota bacterium]
MKTTVQTVEPITAEIRSGGEAARLAEAFQRFNQVSTELSAAYARLQVQVVQLTERMTLLQDALPAGVVVLDGGDRIVEVNAAAEAMLVSGLVGRSWAEVEPALLQASELQGEFHYGAGFGRRLVLTASAIDSGGGRILLLHDVTENHRLKAQAERHERLAAMGELSAQLAHQLRTPLSAALLYAGNLENPDLPQPQRQMIVVKTVDRLKYLERLIQDMLMFARGEALGRETIDVNDLIQDVIQIIEPLARRNGVHLDIRGSAQSVVLHGNRKALSGALANLVDNALHAVGSDGKIEIRTTSDSHHVMFHIRDNGWGMDATVASRLFEPFFTTRPEGTGLGLAIARGVARAHGGSIDVSSTPGAGTEFIFSVALRDHPLPENP